MAIADARLATASAKPLVAIQHLTPLLEHATVPQQFEARLRRRRETRGGDAHAVKTRR